MINKAPYSFLPDLVLRTPRLPLPEELTAQTLPVLLSDPIFLESIYIASPVVYDECIKWKAGDVTPKKIEKLTATLTKYYLRSSSRCTPFGLFSGCSFVTWQEKKSIITLNEHDIERHIRLDMHYLCLLVQKIANEPGITESLTYYVNNSAYKIGDEIRYVEYLFVNAAKKYQITAVQQSEYLAAILNAAKKGKKINDLISLIINDDISEEDARAFIYDLIDAQVIISELDPKLTGDGLLTQIITTLQRITTPAARAILEVLITVQQKLEAITFLQKNHVAAYREIVSLLSEIEPVIDESKIFQIDLNKKVESGNLSNDIQNQLQQAVGVLNKLSVFHKNKNLEAFAINFYNKYESQEMPLSQVLDTETGIGYINNDAGYLTPLIDELILPAKEAIIQLDWNKLEKFLYKKVAVKSDNNCITITDEELKEFDTDWNNLPASFSVMFKVLDTTTDLLQLDNIGGSTGAGLLGRFAYTDKRIQNILADIAIKEQQNELTAVFAEIIHLPENRVGNILLRPAFREYEIPYLAQASVTTEKQIEISDLYVSIKNGVINLRSKRLNKQVIPRLSTAHNFSFNALPVYQLLCDLQTQGVRDSLTFNWGSLHQLFTALPRVMYNNTILSLAQWSFTNLDTEKLIKSDVVVMEDVKHFRHAHQLPQYVILTDGDNELLVDLENEQSVTVWINTIRKRNVFLLKEYLSPTSGVTDNEHNIYANQFIATLYKEKNIEVIPVVNKSVVTNTAVQRSFSLGSQWVYYKLYCGLKTADKILAEAIKPLTDELLRLELIDGFFFIRFFDPEFHIRLRLRLPDTSKIGEVIQLVNSYFDSFIKDGFIWKQQVEVYTRELERYGCNTIEIAESFFYYDSVALLEMLTLTEGDAREEIRWIWAIRAIDELLNCFQFSLQQKSDLLNGLKNLFAEEFKVDKPLTLQLNDRYREHKQAIEQIMNRDCEMQSELYPLIETLYKKNASCSKQAAQIVQLNVQNQLEVSLSSFIESLIHMMVNRIIKSESRLHEMVIYNFISRYYQSAIIKKNID